MSNIKTLLLFVSLLISHGVQSAAKSPTIASGSDLTGEEALVGFERSALPLSLRAVGSAFQETFDKEHTWREGKAEPPFGPVTDVHVRTLAMGRGYYVRARMGGELFHAYAGPPRPLGKLLLVHKDDPRRGGLCLQYQGDVSGFDGTGAMFQHRLWEHLCTHEVPECAQEAHLKRRLFFEGNGPLALLPPGVGMRSLRIDIMTQCLAHTTLPPPLAKLITEYCDQTIHFVGDARGDIPGKGALHAFSEGYNVEETAGFVEGKAESAEVMPAVGEGLNAYRALVRVGGRTFSNTIPAPMPGHTLFLVSPVDESSISFSYAPSVRSLGTSESFQKSLRIHLGLGEGQVPIFFSSSSVLPYGYGDRAPAYPLREDWGRFFGFGLSALSSAPFGRCAISYSVPGGGRGVFTITNGSSVYRGDVGAVGVVVRTLFVGPFVIELDKFDGSESLPQVLFDVRAEEEVLALLPSAATSASVGLPSLVAPSAAPV